MRDRPNASSSPSTRDLDMVDGSPVGLWVFLSKAFQANGSDTRVREGEPVPLATIP